MEMFVNKVIAWGSSIRDFIAWIRVIVLAFSFAALLNFAWLSFLPREAISRRSTLAVSVILGLYVLAIFFVGYFAGQPHYDILPQLDVLFRLLLAVPGAIVAATAIFFQSKRELKRNRLGLANALRLAAIGFFCYGLTQIFVPAADFFPARIINESSFMGWTGVPIQFISSILAVWITLFMLRTIQWIELERQAQFQAVQQARVDAAEQLRLELVEREVMRQELMRHTVIAQEEERARIAR